VCACKKISKKGIVLEIFCSRNFPKRQLSEIYIGSWVVNVEWLNVLWSMAQRTMSNGFRICSMAQFTMFYGSIYYVQWLNLLCSMAQFTMFYGSIYYVLWLNLQWLNLLCSMATINVLCSMAQSTMFFGSIYFVQGLNLPCSMATVNVVCLRAQCSMFFKGSIYHVQWLQLQLMLYV